MRVWAATPGKQHEPASLLTTQKGNPGQVVLRGVGGHEAGHQEPLEQRDQQTWVADLLPYIFQDITACHTLTRTCSPPLREDIRVAYSRKNKNGDSNEPKMKEEDVQTWAATRRRLCWTLSRHDFSDSLACLPDHATPSGGWQELVLCVLRPPLPLCPVAQTSSHTYVVWLPPPLPDAKETPRYGAWIWRPEHLLGGPEASPWKCGVKPGRGGARQ